MIFRRVIFASSARGGFLERPPELPLRFPAVRKHMIGAVSGVVVLHDDATVAADSARARSGVVDSATSRRAGRGSASRGRGGAGGRGELGWGVGVVGGVGGERRGCATSPRATSPRTAAPCAGTPFGSSRNSTPASMLAGESTLGAASSDMTLTITCSTPSTGRHRSAAVSCWFIGSSPGGWRIEMHTCPGRGRSAGVGIRVARGTRRDGERDAARTRSRRARAEGVALTLPSSYTFGWYIFERNVISGGWFGKSSGNCIIALEDPALVRRVRRPDEDELPLARDGIFEARRGATRKDERRAAADALRSPPPTLPPTRSACARDARVQRARAARVRRGARLKSAREKSARARRADLHHIIVVEEADGHAVRRILAQRCARDRERRARGGGLRAVGSRARPGFAGRPRWETPRRRRDPTLAAVGTTHRAVAA